MISVVLEHALGHDNGQRLLYFTKVGQTVNGRKHWARVARPPTPVLAASKSWMVGPRPTMTERQCGNAESQ
jgi:hypothetical protein